VLAEAPPYFILWVVAGQASVNIVNQHRVLSTKAMGRKSERGKKWAPRRTETMLLRREGQVEERRLRISINISLHKPFLVDRVGWAAW
jgi:hypothetical protein